MIETVKQWGFSLCIACICAGTLHIIAPSKGMETIYKVAVNIFFITCLLQPLVYLKNGELPDIPAVYQDGTISADTTAVSDQIARLTAQNLAGQVERYLQQEGLDYEKVEVSVHALEDGSIDIREIKITAPDGQGGQTAQKVQDHFSIPTAVQEDVQDDDG